MNEQESFTTRLKKAFSHLQKQLFFTKLEDDTNSSFFYVNVFFSVVRSLFLTLIVLFFLGGMLGLGIGTGYFAYLVSDTEVPTKHELEEKINDVELISNFTYSNHAKIADIRSDLIRRNVPSKDIQPLVKQALVATEDEYFYEHKGIVPKAILRALVSDVTGFGGSSGGSTITQQLVKQQVLTSETTFKRKANELLLALRLENYFSKDEIITAYLNVSPFGRNNKGQNIAGVEEASKGIFGKQAKELTLPEAAFIAGLPQSPISYSPYENTGELKKDLSYGLKRKDQVLFNMYRKEYLSKKEYEAAKQVDLTQHFLPKEALTGEQNGFLYYTVHDEAVKKLMPTFYKNDELSTEDIEKNPTLWKKYFKLAERELRRNGYTVETTIDQQLYNQLQIYTQTYGYLLDDGRGKPVETGSILMENPTGKILAFVGGRNYTENQNNHAFQTRRSPGSTIKPILAYGPALDVGLIGSDSQLSNFPRKYRDGKTLTNFGGQSGNSFKSARDALKVSDNIPVVNLYDELLNVTDPKKYFDKMNIKLDEHEFKYESLPVGGTDYGLTVYEQTNAYQTLANQGNYLEGYLISKITDKDGAIVFEQKSEPVEVYSKAAASIMADMMRDVLRSGTGTEARNTLNALSPYLAQADWVGKTGTSEDFKDFWFTASTPTITLSTWIGIDDNTPMYESWGNNNMKYWAYLAYGAYEVNPDLLAPQQKFELDNSVIQAKVSDFTGQKLGDMMYKEQLKKVPGKEITSYYATGGPDNSSYHFGIGGTEKDYEEAWKKAPKPALPKTKEDKTDKEDRTKKETPNTSSNSDNKNT